MNNDMKSAMKTVIQTLSKILSLVLCLGCASALSDQEGNWLLAKYDMNGDDQISLDEVSHKKLNIFRHMDTNQDGGVSFDEYETMDVAKRQVLLKSRFNKLDLDQNGRVSEEEYASYRGLFSSIDSNGDGLLTAGEMGLKEQIETEEGQQHCLLWLCVRTSLSN